tara:strand:- start:79 stop:315 length:237 start_codon:yes stop_codon:yes gene_type:complete
MEKAELSKIYGGACNRMHEAVTVLYEALHDYEGHPHVNVEYVVDRVSEYRRWLLIEADLVREAVREYNEEVDRQHREA